MLGRPRGKPTIFWTKLERDLVRNTLDDLARKLPRHTIRAIIQMMLRMDDGEFE